MVKRTRNIQRFKVEKRIRTNRHKSRKKKIQGGMWGVPKAARPTIRTSRGKRSSNSPRGRSHPSRSRRRRASGQPPSFDTPWFTEEAEGRDAMAQQRCLLEKARRARLQREDDAAEGPPWPGPWAPSSAAQLADHWQEYKDLIDFARREKKELEEEMVFQRLTAEAEARATTEQLMLEEIQRATPTLHAGLAPVRRDLERNRVARRRARRGLFSCLKRPPPEFPVGLPTEAEYFAPGRPDLGGESVWT